LYIDGAKQASSPELKLPAEGRTKHSFQFAVERGGLHRGEVRLAGEDGSRFDDRRFFTVEVDQAIPVAIVKPEKHEIAYLEDTFYLEAALSPVQSGAWAITTTSLEAGELVSEPLSNYRVVYCVNLPSLDADAASRLSDYVARGGHLVWFCGDHVSPQDYSEMNDQTGGGLLPAPLVEIRTSEKDSGRDSWSIGMLDKSHPALRQLVEPPSLYQSVLVYKHIRMNTANVTGLRILARLDDGEALIASRRVGNGSVTMIGTTAHVGWTNLPLRPIFLPLVARLTFDLAGVEKTRLSAVAGLPIRLDFGQDIPPSAVEVQPPSGAVIRLSTIDQEGNRAKEFQYAETHDIGVYLLRPLEGVRPVQLAYSINPDPEEAAGERVSREELEKLLPAVPLVFAENPDDLSDTFRWLREGRSLWSLLLAVVLLALVFETFLSNRLTPRHDDATATIAPGMRRLARQGRSVATPRV
jgi:hypothetical protein